MAVLVKAPELRKFFTAFGRFLDSPQSEHDQRLADLIALYDQMREAVT